MEAGCGFHAAVKRGVRILVCTALAVSGAAFLLIGIASGQAGEMLEKAIRVCLECIGIG